MNHKALQALDISVPTGSKDELEKVIVNEQYCHFEGTTVTICLLTLKNGFHVVGESYCPLPELFDKTTGCQRARDCAKAKIWNLEMYAFYDMCHASGLDETE